MGARWDAVGGVLIGFFTRYGLDLVAAVAILIGGMMLAGWAGRAVRLLGKRSAHIDATLVPILATITRLTFQAATLMAVLDKFGVDTNSLLAVVGAAGLAIGLALKDTLSDVASGLVLLVLRPFDVGDTIDVDGTGGVVDAIDLFQTRLTSFEGVPVVLPNSKVRSGKIQNYTRAERRRVDLTVPLRQGADIDQAVAALREVLSKDPRVLADPAPQVNATQLKDGGVEVLVRFWTLPADLEAAKLDLARRLKERLDGEETGSSSPHPAPLDKKG